MIKENLKSNSIDDLSQHLFWDVQRDKITWDSNKEFLVERILDYGLEKDWQILKRTYGLEKIKDIAINLRNLSDMSVSFIALPFNLKNEEFRCYRLRQSAPNYWGY
jgi:hypothetical protein